MYFIVALPLTARRHDSILVVVETLTKKAHFIPVCMTYQEPNIDRVFVNDIVRLHGVPRRIISDQGLVFTGHFLTSFQEALGTQLNFSTTYHSEIDGQKKNEPYFGGYVMYVCNGPTETLGTLISISRICIQQ
jgi:hypothetical protein